MNLEKFNTKRHKVTKTQRLKMSFRTKLTGIKLGLLANFGAAYVKDGISRIINVVL